MFIFVLIIELRLINWKFDKEFADRNLLWANDINFVREIIL